MPARSSMSRHAPGPPVWPTACCTCSSIMVPPRLSRRYIVVHRLSVQSSISCGNGRSPNSTRLRILRDLARAEEEIPEAAILIIPLATGSAAAKYPPTATLWGIVIACLGLTFLAFAWWPL